MTTTPTRPTQLISPTQPSGPTQPPHPTPQTPTTRTTLLPHPRRLVEVRPHGGAHWVALRAGVAVAVPLGILAATGHLELALYAVFGAFTALYGRSHTHVTRLRMQASAGVGLVLAVVIGTAVSVSGARDWIVLPVVAVVAAVATFVADALDWHPPGALFFVFALAACASVPADAGRILTAFVLAAVSAVVAMVISTVGLALPRWRHREPTRLAISFGATWKRPGELAKVVAVAAAVLLAGLIPTATGLGHPYWAMVSAVAALGAADTAGHLIRAGQRVLGTLLGVALAALLLAVAAATTSSAGPDAGSGTGSGSAASPLVLILFIVLLQVGAELFVMRNYGLTMIFVTPLALLMSQLAHPLDEVALLRDRTLETLLGAAVAIAISLVAGFVAARSSHLPEKSQTRHPAPR